MHPYKINPSTIQDFMTYHGVTKLKEVANLMCISAAYLTQLMKGDRPLNEYVRLRLQLLTRKKQDQLFIPKFDSDLFSEQSKAMKKHLGIYPLLPDENGEENPQLEFGRFDRLDHFKRPFWKSG